MIVHRLLPKVAAGLSVSLALTLVAASRAQAPNSGPPLSSGSGAGTGTGMMGGDTRNTTGTGQESGRLGGTTGTGTESGTGPRSWPSREPLLPEVGPRQPLPGGRMPRTTGSIPLGPGATTNFPDNPALFPSPTLPEGEPGESELSQVSPDILRDARAITDPGERSLALQRTANVAIFSQQLPLARQALIDAAEAALRVPVPLIHDQRLTAIIISMSNLAEATLREGKVDLSLPEIEGDQPSALPNVDRVKVIGQAEESWNRAADLAWRILNPTYRVEMLYRVVDNAAYGSQVIINEFPHGGESIHNGGESMHDGQNAEGRAIEAAADRVLANAAATAVRIERPVWRDRALVQITIAASASKQFARGSQVARTIPHPEVRSDALIRLADAQARRGDPQGATQTYADAARSVASIPAEGPRIILTGVLLDDMISVGRFGDAKASVGLYDDRPHQLNALGAIAESQGRRGRADEARAWITREIPPQEQSILYRRVNAGIISAIENSRSKDISNQQR
ncbi:MAG: hypothetical protein JO034_26975 [Singulisphaera sp.]|nr:hypothetical protein [Singulisphaera sp.]